MAGRLIAIEGIDGAGKGTQAQRLCQRFEATGLRTKILSFPRYDKTQFGEFIGEYLNGEFGPLASIDPLFAALLFAGDRLETKPELLEALNRYDAVICDRYVASNIAHQGARVPPERRARLIARIEAIEFRIHGLPHPDLTIYLDVTVPIAKDLIARKSARGYTDQAADMHEADTGYLELVRSAYRDLATATPTWTTISVELNERLRTIEEIESDIWHACQKLL